MSLESFYGGKQGISPVIKASFEYIDTNDNAYQAALAGGAAAPNLLSKTMDLCFADANYENVWYNELCIIDTSNKNNPNNGKLFRRTLKGNGDTGVNLCAEYIGRIVGPAGTSPFFSFGNLNSVNAQGTTEKINVDPSMQISYPVDTNGNISSDKVNGQGVQFNIEPTIQTASIDNNMLVSGKTNDNIRYTWLNVVDDTTDIPTRSIVYMGFEIPYPVLELNSTITEWWNDVDITKRTTGEYSNHPFYHVWDMTIPRGVRGNAATNIRLTQQKEFSNINGGMSGKPVLYNFSDFNNDGTGIYSLRTLTGANDRYGPTDLPNAPNSYIWVYDYDFYDVSAYDDPNTGTKEISKTYSFYLGKYNEISNVILDNDGTLTFEYSNTQENVFDKKIPWVNSVDITSDGLLSFEWNQEDYRITDDLTPQIDKTYYTKTGNNYTSHSGLTEFNPDTTYYEFTDTYSKQLPYPTDINIDANGRIIVGLSGRNSFIVQNPDTGSDYHLDYVKSLSMDNDTKVLSYATSVSNSGTTALNNNKGLNYIEAMTVTDNFHLLVYYASSQYRITSDDIGVARKDNKPITRNDDGSYTWDNKIFRTNGDNNIYWQDFGLVKDTAAVKISTEVDYSRLSNSSTVDNYTVDQFRANILNTPTWSDGGSNPYYGGNIPGTLPAGSGWTLRGTLVFASQINNGSFFFYDYDENEWKHAGSLSEATQIDAQILLNDNTAFNNKTFTDGGVRFIERSTATHSDLLPIF